MKRPNLYVMAGPNGAGKTTFAKKFLPYFADCKEFINADYIAAGLSPFDPSVWEWRAGRVMLDQIQMMGTKKQSFGFESTLSGKAYGRLLKIMKNKGYRITIIFLWVKTPDLAVARVKDRVEKGGHDIPEAVVRRRFYRGLKNFFEIYAKLAHSWMLVDNSLEHHRSIAYSVGGKVYIEDQDQFMKVKKESDSKGYA